MKFMGEIFRSKEIAIQKSMKGNNLYYGTVQLTALDSNLADYAGCECWYPEFTTHMYDKYLNVPKVIEVSRYNMPNWGYAYNYAYIKNFIDVSSNYNYIEMRANLQSRSYSESIKLCGNYTL